MPQLSNPVKSEPKAPSVEQLLRFKKAEQPDQAFWNDFESSLHQRLFQAAVASQRGPVRRWVSAIAHSRAAYAMPAMAGVALMAVVAMSPVRPGISSAPADASSHVDIVVSVRAPAIDTASQGRESFVQDSLQMNMDNGRFRKVMTAGELRLPLESSTRYVADQLGSGSSRGGFLFASNSF
jgi:hypothetical protein